MPFSCFPMIQHATSVKEKKNQIIEIFFSEILTQFLVKSAFSQKLSAVYELGLSQSQVKIH